MSNRSDMKDREDREAHSVIRRAAARLLKDGDVCSTPGCRYTIRFGDNYVACSVRLPDDLGSTVSDTLDTYPYLAPYWEEEVHDMMANAVEEVIKAIRSKVLIADIDAFWRKNTEENLGHKVLSPELMARLDAKRP